MDDHRLATEATFRAARIAEVEFLLARQSDRLAAIGAAPRD